MYNLLPELSSRLEYAILALLELSDRQPNPYPLKAWEIAAAQSIPCRYLDQILIALRRSGLVQGQRGVKGGYLLAKNPQQITLLEIMEAVEGKSNEDESDEGESNHPQLEVDRTPTVERKVIIAAWKQASQAFQMALSNYTLEDLRIQRNTDQPT